MEQQRKSATQQPWFNSHIDIMGYFANKLNYHSEEAHNFGPSTIDESIRSLVSLKKKNSKFTPVKIYLESNTIAVIDNQQKGWIVTDFLAEPICLSQMLRLKIYKISLGYSQLIANTRQGCLLLVWGNKKPINEQNLQKYTIKNTKYKYSQIFQVFKIKQSNKNDSFFFSNLKKVIDDQNSLFSISSGAPLELLIYPKLEKIIFSRKVVGLSVGSRHKLCWDQAGKLYSWGSKCLALGLSNVSQQDEIKYPLQITKIQGHVLKAYAGYNYSLAITFQGKLYQWGIKKIYPAGQQLIFEPKEIKLPDKEKPIDIKGKVDKFGLLTLAGNLYIWGKNVKEYLYTQYVCQRFPKKKASEISYNHPVLASYAFVLDFQIAAGFLGIIYADKKLYEEYENQKSYWLNLKERTRQTVRYSNSMVKTESSQQKSLAQTFYSSRDCVSFKKFKDPVQLALKKHQAKEMFMCAASEPQRLLNYILQPSKKLKERTLNHSQRQKHSHSPSLTDLRLNSIQKQESESNKTMKLLFEEFERRKEFTKILEKGVMDMAKKPKIFRVVRNNVQKTKAYVNINKIQRSYQERLQSVLKKREQLNSQFVQKILQSQEKNSLEYRMLKKKEYQELKNKHKQIQICKLTLQKTLIKAFLVKLFTKPLLEARQLKIANFAKNLKLHRLQKNIKGVFVKNRIRMQLNKLKKNQLTRFFLLLITFKQYVKRFRQRTFQAKRSLITRQIVKKVVRQKIRVGVSASNFNVRKLQKFREWLVLVKNQRKKCLKYLWKVYLLSMMKINSDNESSAIFYLPKNIEDISFQSIYLQKLSNNPLLKLSNFLNKHSIFKIKANYFQKLVTLFSVQSKKMHQSKHLARFSKIKRGRIKFVQDQQMQDKFNLTQTDILPYSLHYNLLIHPSNYDMNISQMIKLNQKWIKQEKKILEKHIQMIIQNHEKQYLKKRRVYEIQLSQYIKKNYQLFAEKRWKYIIQYNKLQKTFQKQKKQNQLKRLMKLTGSQSLLQSDCIPQKQAILDQALKRADSPQIPNNFIVFRQSEFKVLFRSYYEAVATKLKELKRSIH